MDTKKPDPVARATRMLRESAQELRETATLPPLHQWADDSDDLARAAHDEYIAAAEALEAWEQAIGAGGVEPLRKRECLHQISEPQAQRPVFGRPGTRDVDVASAQKAWDTAQAQQAAQALECGNCFEGKSDMQHDCRKCGGAGAAKAVDAEPNDTALLDFIEQHSVTVEQELEGPWEASVDGKSSSPSVIERGATARLAIRAAIDAQQGGAS